MIGALEGFLMDEARLLGLMGSEDADLRAHHRTIGQRQRGQRTGPQARQERLVRVAYQRGLDRTQGCEIDARREAERVRQILDAAVDCSAKLCYDFYLLQA